MRTMSLSTLCLAAVMLTASTVNAEYRYQKNWSGGPGVPGPTTWWGSTFASQEHMSYSSIPTELFLGLSGISHPIITNMYGCYFAFPADMDGDGNTDVLAAAHSSSANYRVAWFENDGSGGGWDMHIISEYYSLLWCAYPADIDSDGDIDVLGANPAVSKDWIEWWRNEDGVGDSWTRFVIDEDFPSRFICAADVTGNDTLEVISVRSGSPYELAWWEPSSYPPDSLWEKHVVTNVGRDCRYLFPCDLDQDGDIDILIARENNNGLQWCENLDGSGTSWVKHQIGGYFDIASSAHAADIDGDGDIDVVMSSNQDGELVWFENLNGSATSWERHLIEAYLNSPGGVHAADVTGDGYTDVILGKQLYRNMDGTGQQWAKFQYASGGLNPEVADFNQDGKPDILSTGIYWHELEGHTEGWLLSSILDMTSYPQWDSITWTAEEPPGTDIFFQLRSSNDWEEMGAWSDTIFEPRSLEGIMDSTHRYMQHRVGMTSETEFQSPMLDEVRFYWTFLGIEGGEGTEEFSISAFPNPSAGSVSILVPPVFLEEAEIRVYDISGRFIRKLSGTDGSVFAWDCRDTSGNEIPPGIYIVRGTAGGRSHSVRFVKM